MSTHIKSKNKRLKIEIPLIRRLIEDQFPQWQHLSIQPTLISGWDNITFRLGKNMLIRMPSAEAYAVQVEKEQYWLPKLAPHLPLPIPTPLAVGNPDKSYPYKWSIYQWLPGEALSSAHVTNVHHLIIQLAQFLSALHHIDASSGPAPGKHNFYRGGELSIYESETRQAIDICKDSINTTAAIQLWEAALNSNWEKPPVWVHGDLTADNLLATNGRLSAVIDFGMLAVGDPACDLSINWTFLYGENRQRFYNLLPFDDNTWLRAAAWTLWKALVTAVKWMDVDREKSRQALHIVDEVLADEKIYRLQASFPVGGAEGEAPTLAKT